MQLPPDEGRSGSKALKSLSPQTWGYTSDLSWPTSPLGNKTRCHGLPQKQRALFAVREHGKNDTECKGSSSSWSMVSKWSLGKRGRTQTRAFPSTFPNAVAHCLKMLDRITRGNGHKPALLFLVLCQTWQTIVWSICRHNSSSLLPKLFGADLQILVHKAQPKSHSRWAAAHMPPVCPGDMSAWLIPTLSLCRFHSPPAIPCWLPQSYVTSCSGEQRWQTPPKSENQFC